MKITVANCSICCGDIITNCKSEEQSAVGLICGHIYHSECIKKWLLQKNSCPHCRKSIPNRKDILPLIFDFPEKLGGKGSTLSSSTSTTTSSSTSNSIEVDINQNNCTLTETDNFEDETTTLKLEIENLNNELLEAKEEMESIKVTTKRQVSDHYINEINKYKSATEKLKKAIEEIKSKYVISRSEILNKMKEIKEINEKVKFYKNKLDVAAVMKGLTTSGSSAGQNNNFEAKFKSLDRPALLECLTAMRTSLQSEQKKSDGYLLNMEDYKEVIGKKEQSLKTLKRDNKILNQELTRVLNDADDYNNKRRKISKFVLNDEDDDDEDHEENFNEKAVERLVSAPLILKSKLFRKGNNSNSFSNSGDEDDGDRKLPAFHPFKKSSGPNTDINHSKVCHSSSDQEDKDVQLPKQTQHSTPIKKLLMQNLKSSAASSIPGNNKFLMMNKPNLKSLKSNKFITGRNNAIFKSHSSADFRPRQEREKNGKNTLIEQESLPGSSKMTNQQVNPFLKLKRQQQSKHKSKRTSCIIIDSD